MSDEPLHSMQPTQPTGEPPADVPAAPTDPTTAPVTDAAMPAAQVFEPQPVGVSPTTTDTTPQPAPAVPAETAIPTVPTQTTVPEPVVTTPVDTSPTVSAPIAATPSLPVAPASPAAVVGGSVNLPPAGPSPKKRGRKVLLFAGAGLVVLLIAAGGVFGLYLPNTPNNVYNTAINRSGKAVNGLVQDATSKSKLAAYKTTKITGAIDATYGTSHYGGDITTSFDKSKSTASINVNFKDDTGAQQKLSLNTLSQIPTGSAYPNIYLQLSGIKNLGLDEFVPGASSYDGKWIFISSTYLQSIGDEFLKTDDNTKTQITADDVAEVVRSASDVSQQYLFSTASDKAVLEKRSYVGKEQVDGLTAYHYKVVVNAAHAKAYCKALSDAVLATNAYKKVTGHAATATDKTDAEKSCDTSDSSYKDTYDMWIDGHYKLIYKIRFYDTSDHNSYADVGQIYKGGDELSLFIRGHDAGMKADGELTVDTNLKTNETTAAVTAKGTGTTPFDLKVNLKAVLASDAVQVTPPTTSIKLEDLLKQFGIDAPTAGVGSSTASPSSSSTAVTPSAAVQAEDSTRQTAIRTLQSHVEESFADNGVYPTLAQFNDPSWRKTNMADLDDTVLTPPNSQATTLAAAASPTQYGYAPGDCQADGCQSYVLEALLSDGSRYKVDSNL